MAIAPRATPMPAPTPRPRVATRASPADHAGRVCEARCSGRARLPLADHALLRGTRDEPARAIEELTAHETATTRRRRAVHDIEQPVIDPERPVEPHHV